MNEIREVSVTVPVYNEERSVGELYERTKKALEASGTAFEMIFVDDGSTDGTFAALKALNGRDRRVRAVKLRRNYGQTAAMAAGFKAARYGTVVSIDADLQNDPADIPELLKKLGEGYDVVCGWRHRRKDPPGKVVASYFANILRKSLTGETIHDSGCSLRAYRKACLGDLILFGEMHRFIPALLAWQGYRITEIKVGHKERAFGRSKYGMKRLAKGLMDLALVKFWVSYSSRPLYLFGTAGAAVAGIGFVMAAYLVGTKLFMGAAIGNRPMLTFSVLFMMIGAQLFIFGILADILIKIYYEKKGPYYNIETTLE